jgi:hypothetical protein
MAVEVCPFRFNGYEPTALGRPEDRGRIAALRRHLRDISLGVGGGELGEPGLLGCMPLRPLGNAEPAVAAMSSAEASKPAATGYDGVKRATGIGDSRTP